MESSSSLVQDTDLGRVPISFAPDDGNEDRERKSPANESGEIEHEELPYKVELWDADRQSVVQVLAVTANASIGYAAYFAATREYPDRYITLRHKNRVVSSWNTPTH